MGKDSTKRQLLAVFALTLFIVMTTWMYSLNTDLLPRYDYSQFQSINSHTVMPYMISTMLQHKVDLQTTGTSVSTAAPKVGTGGYDNENNGTDMISDFKCELDVPLKQREIARIDPERFILPILFNGPTNQLVGFRDSVYMSVRLNRTLILPVFKKHKTDDGLEDDQQVPIEMRLNLKSLSLLIPTVSYDRRREVCPTFDVILPGRSDEWLVKRGADFERLLSLHNISASRQPNQQLNIFHYPPDVENYIVQQGYSPPKKNMYDWYKSSAKCVLYVYPFHSVSVAETPNSLIKADAMLQNYKENHTKIDVANLDDYLLYAVVSRSTGLPEFIKEIVTRFYDDVLRRNDVLAIHWRFDPADWELHCRGTLNYYKELCEQITTTTAVDIVGAVRKYIKKFNHMTNRTINTMYFASPPSQQKLKSGIQDEINLINKQSSNFKLRLLTSRLLSDFLNKFSFCPFIANRMNDVLSLVEMEICTQSTLFLYSSHSSWSRNVVNARGGKPFSQHSKEILKLAWKEHNES